MLKIILLRQFYLRIGSHKLVGSLGNKWQLTLISPSFSVLKDNNLCCLVRYSSALPKYFSVKLSPLMTTISGYVINHRHNKLRTILHVAHAPERFVSNLATRPRLAINFLRNAARRSPPSPAKFSDYHL